MHLRGYKIFTFGLLWTAAAGSWYVFGTWSESLRNEMLSGKLAVLTFMTGAAIGLPWLLIVTEKRWPAKRPLVVGIALAHLAVIAVNAISRQVVQNIEIGSYFDVVGQKTEVQYGPMGMFLIAFVFGLGVLAWMLTQAIKASRRSDLA